MTFPEIWKYRPYIRTLLSRWCQNHSDVDDLEQDVVIHLYHVMPTFRGECHITTWIYRIARNQFVNFCARQKPTCTLTNIAEPMVSDCQEEIINRDILFKVCTAVRKLSRKNQRVFNLVLLKGHTYREAAKKLKVSTSTVGVRMNRLRIQLGNQLSYG